VSVDEAAPLADLDISGVPEEDTDTDSDNDIFDERLSDSIGVLEADFTADRESESLADVDLDT
jgi:hypothetical protein